MHCAVIGIHAVWHPRSLPSPGARNHTPNLHSPTVGRPHKPANCARQPHVCNGIGTNVTNSPAKRSAHAIFPAALTVHSNQSHTCAATTARHYCSCCCCSVKAITHDRTWPHMPLARAHTHNRIARAFRLFAGARPANVPCRPSHRINTSYACMCHIWLAD